MTVIISGKQLHILYQKDKYSYLLKKLDSTYDGQKWFKNGIEISTSMLILMLLFFLVILYTLQFTKDELKFLSQRY